MFLPRSLHQLNEPNREVKYTKGIHSSSLIYHFHFSSSLTPPFSRDKLVSLGIPMSPVYLSCKRNWLYPRFMNSFPFVNRFRDVCPSGSFLIVSITGQLVFACQTLPPPFFFFYFPRPTFVNYNCIIRPFVDDE